MLVVNWLSGCTGKWFHHTEPSLDHLAIILKLVCVTEEQQDTFQTPYMYFPDTLDALSRHLRCTFHTVSVSQSQIALCTLQLPDTLHVLSRHLRCSFQTPSIISRQHSDTTQYLPDPNWAKPVQSGPSRHLPGTFQTRFRDLPDTLQTPFKHQFKKKVCENRTFKSKVKTL